jgi:hypothetical protein
LAAVGRETYATVAPKAEDANAPQAIRAKTALPNADLQKRDELDIADEILDFI